MTAQPRRAVLSEHFQERMQGRKLVTAVFLTYRFEPSFFEQEVLPVFLDLPASHATAVRTIQLEDALRTLRGEVAVYYDLNGLVAGEAGSPKLDIRRIPVRHGTGVFHPKNVLLLVEEAAPPHDGVPEQSLLVACLSANLTRAGWWQNVEACHVEEITPQTPSRLRDDLRDFLRMVRAKAAPRLEHRALGDILTYLRDVPPLLQRSAHGRLHTHLYAGTESVPDFLERVAGSWLQGTYLEILSPYFDDADYSRPLDDLVTRFQPKEVRVLLPRSATGEAQCRPDFYESVRSLPNVSWGRLAKDLVRMGKDENATSRTVHAKLYRFFTQSPKREICFVGSANLTRAAHQQGGNVESGFLVDFIPDQRPDFWLVAEHQRPSVFELREEIDQDESLTGSPLNLRYRWDTEEAELFWNGKAAPRSLVLRARGIQLGAFTDLPSETWVAGGPEFSKRVEDALLETAIFEVVADGGKRAVVMVQEEGMAQKPSLLLSLSVADILRYWALLTPAQRASFIEARATELMSTSQGAELVVAIRMQTMEETLFDRFAGIFHAFGCMERATTQAFEERREREVDARIFGRKYDSLGQLLAKVERGSASQVGQDDRRAFSGDDVDRYVIAMCARQLCQWLKRERAEYWSEHAAEACDLELQIHNVLTPVRASLLETGGPRMSEFLDWFDRWFVARARPVEETAA